MALTGTLGTALTTTTNPNPNTLATVAPMASAFKSIPYLPSASWIAQAKPALFPMNNKDGFSGTLPIKLHFVPSGGATVTYTITVWMYDPTSQTWATPVNTPTISYTGSAIDYIMNPGVDPIFLQIVSISGGTLSIYYDSTNSFQG